MINNLTRDSLHQLNNPDFKRYAQRYADIEDQTLLAIERYGLRFNQDKAQLEQTQSLKKQLAEAGAVFANNGKSIHINWLSSACRACRTGEGSYTTFLSLKCHRDCYFCFNPNQENYDFYQHNQRDALDEIKQIVQAEIPLTHIALTGGEPLLYRDESVSFFSRVKESLPEVHSRLYTAGDPLDRKTAERLRDAGLQEIRFSIKIDDSAEKREKLLQRIALARRYIPTVMVEMPVLPDSWQVMCDLLIELDNIGVDGINLLEFCFPLNNAGAFKERGFELKYPPYEVFYNYWYAGGLAIAGSENLCLALMLFALNNNLKLGVHYCSLENKHTGQVYQQNFNYEANETLLFSPVDYFFKSAKAFGDEALLVQRELTKHRAAFTHNLQHNFIQFNPLSIPLLTELNIEICLSSFIVESDESGAFSIKEVSVAKTTPSSFELSDVQGVSL